MFFLAKNTHGTVPGHLIYPRYSTITGFCPQNGLCIAHTVARGRAAGCGVVQHANKTYRNSALHAGICGFYVHFRSVLSCSHIGGAGHFNLGSTSPSSTGVLYLGDTARSILGSTGILASALPVRSTSAALAFNASPSLTVAPDASHRSWLTVDPVQVRGVLVSVVLA